MKDFKREYSAGCVVYKTLTINHQPSTIKFLLGKHSGYHKWVLPKGLIEKGERGWQAALRETEEEVGVKARLVLDKPIYTEKYVYFADLKKLKVKSEKLKVAVKSSKLDRNTRRVEKYEEEGGEKTKVFKTVSFYLAEYVSGSPEDYGWEMEEAGWFEYKKALELMAFKGEKQALEKAQQKLQELSKQPFLF